jgi:hypothetical protein
VSEATTSKIVLAMTFAAALLGASNVAHAAPQSGAQAPETKPEPQAPSTPNGTEEPPKTEPQAPTTPESGATETPPAVAEDAPATLGDLTREGFEIVTTDFIPAEAVTRQSGKVSSDAMVVTLQKQNATAVCFYTLKAYVGKKLTAIPACTVHR